MKIAHMLILPALAACLSLAPAAAQDDYRLFREKAGGASLLFRGQKAYAYGILYNGTCYWSGPEFRKGSVLYDGKRYDDILLNIDAARQDLLVRIPGSIVDKVLDRSFVESFSMDGQEYLNLQFRHGSQAPSGYWAVLRDGRYQFLLRISKVLEQDIDGRKQNQTGYDGPYRQNVHQTFTRTATYRLVCPDGKIVPVRRRRDLLKLFEPSLRREIRRYIGRREGSNLMPFEQYCVEVLKYVESK